MKRLGIVLAIAMVGVMPARAADHSVEVRNNIFLPQKIEIDVGDTVIWTTIDEGHTVTAADGRFDFDGGSTLNAGEQVQWTFTTDETVSYFCKVHAGMVGVVEVGDGTPIPPPGGGPSEIRTVPSIAYPTIGDALLGILPRGRVEVGPGTYDESIVLLTTGVEVVGTGTDPSDVVIEAGSDQVDGVLMFADETAVANLTVTGAGLNGIRVNGPDSFAITDVRLVDNDRTGVLVENASGGWIEGAFASGHRRAGFVAADCPVCDTVFTGLTSTGNYVGIDIDDARGVVVSGSTVTDNGTGIMLRTTVLEGTELDPDAPQFGAHVYGNVVSGNVRMGEPTHPTGPMMPLRTGTGIFVGAGNLNIVEGNEIDGHLYGIAVTALIGPTFRNTIIGNTVSASTAADLAWDGIGLETCFGGNVATTTEPAVLEALYDCALPFTVGVPFPLTDLTILDWGTV